MTEAPAGLYLHVPFCARVCPYCDFAVRTGDRDRRRRYTDHLLAEIELYVGDGWRFDTVYLGGGTPSHLDPEDLGRILAAARGRLGVAGDAGLFLEANPEDVTAEAAAAWRALGVDTLSLGVQALNPEALEFLGRLHDVDGARRAVRRARDAAFATVSIDLIYGLPGQSPAAWQAEMDRALALEPDHISCYQLTVHAGTRFGAQEKRGMLAQLPADEQAELFHLTHRHLNAAGWQGYEVSQFARSPRHRSRHNRKYWDHTPYLGLGPAAHSHRGNRRWWNLRTTGAWEARLDAGERPVQEGEVLDPPALALEALMTGLRTYDGVDLERVRARDHIDLAAANEALIGRLCAGGLLTLQAGRLTPTLDGMAVADSLAAMFNVTTAA